MFDCKREQRLDAYKVPLDRLGADTRNVFARVAQPAALLSWQPSMISETLDCHNKLLDVLTADLAYGNVAVKLNEPPYCNAMASLR